MKKLALYATVLLSATTLIACSVNKQSQDAVANKETSTTSSVVVSEKTVDNSQYDAIVSELKSVLDPENTGEIEITIENNIVDSEYPDGHDVIRVLATGESKSALKELLSAVDSNTATDEQETAIMMFRMMISELAKELPNDTATISFGYEISSDQYDVVALSSKTKDIIPID